MATADNVRAKLNNLIAQANKATGNSDTDLTAAVLSLIAGYGQGGSSGGLPSGLGGIYYGTYTPAETTSDITVSHELNTASIMLALVYVKDKTVDATEMALMQVYVGTDMQQRISGTGESTVGMQGFFANSLYHADYGMARGLVPSSDVYTVSIVDKNTVKFRRAGVSNANYVSGQEYRILIVAGGAE